MKLAKLSLLFAFLTVVVGCVHGQSNFLKGYYVTTNRDTVKGYIEYVSEVRSNKICVFRKDETSKTVKLYPKDIVGFTIDDSYFYESHAYKGREGEEELFGFFRVLFRGKLTLLKYQQRDFARDSAGRLSEISKFRTSRDNKVTPDNYGLGMLRFLMKDCEETTGRSLDEDYNRATDFTNLFRKYSECTGSPFFQPSSRIAKAKPHLSFGVLVSPIFSSIAFASTFDKAGLQNELSYSVGGFASFFMPKVDERARFVVEFTYSKYSQYAFFSTASTNNDLFLDYSCLKTPLFVKYTPGRFFVDVGMQNQFILSQNTKWRVESIQQSNVFTSEGKMEPLTTSIGFLVGLGINYQLVNHICRSSVRLSQTYSMSHPYSPTYQTVELNLSVQLTK